MTMLGLQLPSLPPVNKQKLELPAGLTNLNPAAMSMWQQQILGQYAMMNGLLAPGGDTRPKAEADTSLRHHMASIEQNKDMMNLHLNQVIMSAFRPENGSYVCSVCHSSYTNKGNFKQHIEKHFKNGEYPSAVNGGETLNGKHSIFGEWSIIH